MSNLPTYDYLQECFSYNAETGELFWKVRPLEHFKNETVQKMWNSRFSTKLIKGSETLGYIAANLDGKTYPMHRVIYKLYHNTEPKKYIIHKDGDTMNNRIENLISSEVKVLLEKRKPNTVNTSGYNGISLNSKTNKWVVKFQHNNESIYLGSFDDKQNAINAHEKFLTN